MISFSSDYIAGAHPQIIKRLTETNLENLSGYGSDPYCDSAKEKIKAACGIDTAQVEFLVGGTQTNAVVISTMLHDSEAVVAATTGHVAAHEAGAIEYTGHEVLMIPGHEGKIFASELDDYVSNYYADENHEHMPCPGMVYISHPTEYGTLYTKSELQAIREVCDKFNMTLFLDGARLGYGLMSKQTDVTLQDIAKLTDVFYIGGTKVGALCGEAIVFTKNNKPRNFLTSVKKRGALIAKGRLLGVQFDTLFTDGLYFEIGRHGIEMAEKIKKLFAEKNMQIFIESPTNQQFVVLENDKIKELEKNVVMGFWEKYDDTHTVMRFATSWSTTEEDIAELEKLL